MKESHFYFDSSGSKLYGCIYSPSRKNLKKEEVRKGYIIIHPFAEEKKCSHKILVELARKLYYVFLFDLYGCGDSEGDFSKGNITRWLTDLDSAQTFFCKEYKIISTGFIGLRLGGFISLIFGSQMNSVDQLVLLEPILSPQRFFRQLLRKKMIKEFKTFGIIRTDGKNISENIKEDNIVDFDGYAIGSKFFKDIAKYNIDKLNFTKSISILGLSKTNSGYGKKYVNSLQNDLNIQYKQLDFEPFWDKIEIQNYNRLIEVISRECII
ncbi:MAG: serine aminopeptidase domain-containing protein [Candidatus Thorarchaeota archaeon]